MTEPAGELHGLIPLTTPATKTAGDPQELEPAPLDGLKARIRAAREKALGQASFHIPVAGMEDTLSVEYAAMDSATVTDLARVVSAGKGNQLDLFVKELAAFARGVYYLDEQGERTRYAGGFDEDLAEALDVPYISSDHLVRALYVTDGNIGSTVQALEALSGYGREREIEAAVRGN